MWVMKNNVTKLCNPFYEGYKRKLAIMKVTSWSGLLFQTWGIRTAFMHV